MADVVTTARPRRMPKAPKARALSPVLAGAPTVPDATTAPTEPSTPTEVAAASSPAMRPRLGCVARMPDRVGPYRVHGLLGSGGVGVVYEAEDEGLGRMVAVKVLRDASPANVGRFRREARAMGRVNHPNVATVYDVGESEGRGYIAMELVRGGTLREWIRRGPTWAQLLATLRQAGEGIAAAHAAGLVHRDFKPDNVLVGDDGRARVVDFGLAKHHAEASPERLFDRELLARELADAKITRTGALMGTPAYMAPEQFLGQGDARSDQFAFCVVLYEALYGQLPFAGDTAEALFNATACGRLRPAPRRSEVPAAILGVLRRGLSASADDRYDSMAALLEALSRAVDPKDGTSRRRGRGRTKGTRSWKWRIVGGATGLLLAVGSAWLGGSGEEATGTTARARAVSMTAGEDMPDRTVGSSRTDRADAAGRAAARRLRRDRARRPAQS